MLRACARVMDSSDPTAGGPPRASGAPEETFNPWSVVNLVFRHLADEGLHPVLGESGDPGGPAAALLEALGIVPSTDGNKKITKKVSDELAELRAAYEASHPVSG